MKLTIPRPCHENWDNMTPEEKGKFCSVCSQSVYDFTDLSDEEISNFNFDQKICGRFREDQLGRNLNFSIAGKLAAGLLIAGGGLSTFHAQEAKSQEITVSDASKENTLKKEPFRLIIGHTASDLKNHFLILLDNKKSSAEEYRQLAPGSIESIKIIKDKTILEQYGKEAEDGVIVITTKKEKQHIEK
ncbi:hypothetical protein [Chryseobacterium sp. MEBOG07]|uniref:hypothetical protein n=1 Tax=Chryseobacterium sp. MEBOG07 TaxID=2879939 RepID=UPI001F2A859F|nr:hypothetical protein [Chryseobacterium sp. MEBOG07]UKB81401.1 hypothetical protein LF886_10530 [Chryseobacterium sp. MEBOG07]